MHFYVANGGSHYFSTNIYGDYIYTYEKDPEYSEIIGLIYHYGDFFLPPPNLGLWLNVPWDYLYFQIWNLSLKFSDSDG